MAAGRRPVAVTAACRRVCIPSLRRISNRYERSFGFRCAIRKLYGISTGLNRPTARSPLSGSGRDPASARCAALSGSFLLQQAGERLVVLGDVCVLLRQDPHLRAELLLLRLPGGRLLLQGRGVLLVLRRVVGHQLREIVDPRAQDVQLLDVLLLIGQCLPRHTNREFLRFLRRLDHEFPRDLTLHLILDNYGTHTHPNVKTWLAAHPRFVLHFTPTSASWLNLVERWFREITTKRIRRGVFHSVDDLVAAIDAYLHETNRHPKPFVWTASVEAILEKIDRCKDISETLH